MYHLLLNTNRGIKSINEDKDSTVYTTKYRSKRNPTVKPRWARRLQPQHCCKETIRKGVYCSFLEDSTLASSDRYLKDSTLFYINHNDHYFLVIVNFYTKKCKSTNSNKIYFKEYLISIFVLSKFREFMSTASYFCLLI